ncbi:MAG: 4Fe-4S binding protein [Thermoplasmatota archaeon]
MFKRRKWDPAVDGMKPPRKWMKIEPIRLLGQLFLVVLLNFTVVGSIYVSPFLPVLRLDIPFTTEVPGFYEHGQIRACPMATFGRIFTNTWELTLFFFVLAMFFVVVLIVGRALCGWACPFGLIQDLLTRLRNGLGIRTREFSQRTHERLTLVRFAILGFFLLFALSIGISAIGNEAAGGVYQDYFPEGTAQTAPYCATCPTPSLFYVLRVVTFQEPLGIGDPVHIAMWTMLGIFFIGAFWQPRFFCRYVCPTGALSSPFNKVSLLHMNKDLEGCTKCHICHTNCPMRVREVLDEDKKERLGDMDCIFCGECVQRCPERVLTFKFGPWYVYRGGTKWSDRLAFRKRKGGKEN